MKRCIVGIPCPEMPKLPRSLQWMDGYGLEALQKDLRDEKPIALATAFTILLD